MGTWCSATNIGFTPPPFPNNYDYLLSYFDERMKIIDGRQEFVDETCVELIRRISVCVIIFKATNARI